MPPRKRAHNQKARHVGTPNPNVALTETSKSKNDYNPDIVQALQNAIQKKSERGK